MSAADYHSSIPLHLACQKGHLKCVVRERWRREDMENININVHVSSIFMPLCVFLVN